MLDGLRKIVQSASFVPGKEATSIHPIVQDLLSEFPEEVAQLVRMASRDELGSTSLGRTQIEHIFRNLIGNATAHNPDSDLQLEIGKGHRKGLHAHYFKDNGSGIRPDQLPQIFLPFKRGSKTSSKGLGLGLAIVHGINSGAGGEIWCESRVGEGTTFWFTLAGAGET